MKKSLLLFGANSYIGKKFQESYAEQYTIHPVYRTGSTAQLTIDFTDESTIDAFCKKIDFSVDAIIFLQGINPSKGFNDITSEHFLNMMKVNLVAPTLLVRGLQGQLSDNCSVLFFSSVSKRKGSYDPSYASAKAGLFGLMQSLANANARLRFNIISLGLVENSPVYNQMTDDFRAKHAGRMRNGQFVKAENVCSVIDTLINNESINRADIEVDNGYV